MVSCLFFPPNCSGWFLLHFLTRVVVMGVILRELGCCLRCHRPCQSAWVQIQTAIQTPAPGWWRPGEAAGLTHAVGFLLLMWESLFSVLAPGFSTNCSCHRALGKWTSLCVFVHYSSLCPFVSFSFSLSLSHIFLPLEKQNKIKIKGAKYKNYLKKAYDEILVKLIRNV